MSQPIKQEQIDDGDGNDEEIRSIDSSKWTLETASIGTIGDGNAQGNGINSINVPSENLLVHHRIPLPLELNCQIFECLKFGIQRKFIGGLGRGIYGIFRQKLLTKTKKLRNPEQNGWELSNTAAIICFNGLQASNNTGTWQKVYAKKGFPIICELSRADNFPGTILYYFEVTNISCYRFILVGLSSENILDYNLVGFKENSYAIRDSCEWCLHSGKFVWLNGSIKPEWDGNRDVFGCGLVLNPQNKLSIFFTGNGILMGKPIPINSTADLLYPTVSMYHNGLIEANFGEDSANPFKYDIDKYSSELIGK